MMKTYDFIVVGAGTAGAPLATRLSEDPSCEVLLLEAGLDAKSLEEFPSDLLDVSVMTGAMPGHPNNWVLTGNLTPRLSYAVPRGKVLGGTSGINGVYFVRPRNVDLERWAAAGNTEWTPEKVLPYFKRMEDDIHYGETEQHGQGGPIPVYRELDSPSMLTRAFYAAAKEIGFTEDPDKNDMRSLEGYGPMPRNSREGMRINTGIAYVNPARASRPNLTVRGSTLVHRVLFQGAKAVGVVAERNGKTEEIHAGEVILCAGAIKSAHILLLSGLGPAGELEKVGIRPLCDLRVGKNFSDHPDMTLNWKPTRALRRDDRHLRQLFEGTLNWTASGSSTPGDLEVFPMLRSFDRAMGGVIKAGLSRPVGMLKSLNGVSMKRLVGQLLRGTDLSFAVLVNQPDSLGDMTITSANPHTNPRIDYNYLSARRDLERMREGLRTGVRLLRTEAFRDCFDKLTDLGDAVLENDSALDDWSRRHLSLAIHMTGTAKMGADTDPASVVDQYGRVHGVQNLRVADISILPHSPSRAPAATAVLVGEKVADFIKHERVPLRESQIARQR